MEKEKEKGKKDKKKSGCFVVGRDLLAIAPHINCVAIAITIRSNECGIHKLPCRSFPWLQVIYLALLSGSNRHLKDILLKLYSPWLS